MIKQFPLNQRFIDENGRILPGRAYDLLRQLIQLDILEGSGSPELVVEATTRRLYMDTAGTAGNILYIKRDADDGSGDRTGGWILV